MQLQPHLVHLICGSTGAYQLGFDVTREMFDFVESLWEPPTDAEMRAYNGVRSSGN